MEVKLADVPGIAVPDLGTTLGYVKNDKKIDEIYEEIDNNTDENIEAKSLSTIKNKSVVLEYIERCFKRIIDIIGGVFGVLLLIPLTIFVAILNFINKDYGPIFYTQDRIGKDGKHFKMFKYRTMVTNADEKLEKLLQEDEEARQEYKKYYNKRSKTKMIDIHTHILPNIDDGSRSIEETFNLIKEAQEAGFNKVVLTSHYMEGYYETDSKEREVWLNAIYQNLGAKNIKVDLYLGNEIYMSENIIKLLEEGKASTMNETSYVLFELPLNAEPLNLYDIIYQMQQCKIVPILAHPERYEFVKNDPELVYDLIKKGVLMQANYGSILGQYGEKTKIMVTKLLENNMIHMLGSDAHRQNSIYNKIPECLEKIQNIIGAEKLEKLTTTNPNLVLNNKRIDIEEPTEIEYTIKDKFNFLTGGKLNKVFNKFVTK